MKFIILALALFISGCSTPVPIKMKFPVVPESFLTPCPELKKLEDNAKLSDVAKSVTENYSLYHECSLKNEMWGEWYKAHKKIFEEIK